MTVRARTEWSTARERGMVTAETAMVVPFLVALAFALVWATTVAITQVRLVDAAREGARMAARGDARDAVVDGVRAMAPDGADVKVAEQGDATTAVTVRHDARIDLPLVRGLAMHLSATAVSATEDAG